MQKHTSKKREGPQQAKPRFPRIAEIGRKVKAFMYRPQGPYGVERGHSRGQKNYKS